MSLRSPEDRNRLLRPLRPRLCPGDQSQSVGVGTDIAVVQPLTPVSYSYPEYSITLRPLLCRQTAGEAAPREHAAIAWCSTDDLRKLDWVPADRPVLEEYLTARQVRR